MHSSDLKHLILKTVAWFGSTIVSGAQNVPLLKDPRRILVFQAGGIGDLFRIFPLLESVRAAFPNAELYTLSPFHTSVFALLQDPQIITQSIPYYPTSDHRSLKNKTQLVRTLRTNTFDLIINPGRGEGMLQNSLLAYAIGAPIRVGFDDAGAGFANTVRVRILPNQPLLQQNLNLLRSLGIQPQVERIHLHVPQNELTHADAMLTKTGAQTELLIAIHPGSTWQSRLQWRLPRYIELITSLLRECPCTILLLGTSPEIHLGATIEEQVDSSRVINLIGKTSLLQAAALISRCALFIGNDSGLLHLAQGLRTPTVGLFGYTLPQQVISPESPCVAIHYPKDAHLYLHQAFFAFDDTKPNPIDNIHVSDVLDAVKSLLPGKSQ